MGWWIAGAVVLVALLGLAAVGAVLQRRLVELGRVATLARGRAVQAHALQASVGEVQATLAGVNQRSAHVQRRPAGREQQRPG